MSVLANGDGLVRADFYLSKTTSTRFRFRVKANSTPATLFYQVDSGVPKALPINDTTGSLMWHYEGDD